MVRGFEWSVVLSEVSKRVPPVQYNAWLESVRFVDVTDHCLLVDAPNAFSRDWIREHYRDLFQEVVRDLYGMKIDFKVTHSVREEPVAAEAQPEPMSDARIERCGTQAPIETSVATPVAAPAPSKFHQQYTFERFIVGSSNRFAAAAAQAVADAPGTQYNPLFIHGPTSVGKTHLLNAIANRLTQRNPRIKICCISAENFTNELIEALKAGRMVQFRQKYREKFDVLLVDDVQFIAGKEHTQEEFFNTFNALYSMGRQVVFASDRHPRDIEKLEDRLRSRFESGLTADIRLPDLETRMAIVRALAEERDLYLPADVSSFLAVNIPSSVRAISGAVLRLSADRALLGGEITLDWAKRVFPEFAADRGELATRESILAVVCTMFGVKPAEVKGQGRTRTLATARQVAMYLMRVYCGQSLPEIGKFFGDRNHATVLHAVEKIEEVLKTDSELTTRIRAIETEIAPLRLH